MESGEKEIRLAFEETTTRNVKTTVDYSTETRSIVRDLEKKVITLEGKLLEYDKRFALLTLQLSEVQMKLYAGGTV